MPEHPLPPKRIFPTSEVDARAAEHVPSIPQTESPAYKLAFQDTEFLLREDLRPVRFQLELLKLSSCSTKRISARPSSSTARRGFRRPTWPTR